jgi:large subunit ribosomal protein L17
MRHGKTVNHLGRTTSHRKAMLSNMACSLIVNKRISTTLAKAKALRKFVEPILTKSKTDSTNNRRVTFSYLKDKESVKELFGNVAEKIANRPGGYTRILKIGNREGDNAEMCIIELVDYNENMLGTAKVEKVKTRRGKTKKADSAVETPSAEIVEEAKPKKAKKEKKSEDSAENTDNNE